VTRNWRSESAALFGLWAAATALLVAAAGESPRPVRADPLPRAAVAPVAPARRPPVARPGAPVGSPGGPAAEASGEGPAVDAVGPSTDPVDVMEFEPIEISGFGGEYYVEDEDEPYDPNLEYYRLRYAWRSGQVPWRRSWRFFRGRVLRPAASPFLSDGAVPVGMDADPCAALPYACAATPGGAWQPPAAPAPSGGAAARRRYGSPAAVTRDGDVWRLANDLVTIELDALCRIVSRPAGASTPSVVALAPPTEVACARREVEAPWDDRVGAAVELSWDSPAGSMRAVVALADDGAAAEASVSRTDPSGETWLANLGATALTWTVAGSPVTVAAGASVRVAARRSAGT
jgi:hypothetical protein